MLLIPVKTGEVLEWKIWVLSTWLEGLVDYPEDVKLLQKPKQDLGDRKNVNTDVFIIGGGNA